MLTAVEVALRVKVVVNRAMDGGEFLQCSHAPEAQHCPLPSSNWLVGILRPIVGPPAGFLAIRDPEIA